jgi:hypothetical protein
MEVAMARESTARLCAEGAEGAWRIAGGWRLKDWDGHFP